MLDAECCACTLFGLFCGCSAFTYRTVLTQLAHWVKEHGNGQHLYDLLQTTGSTICGKRCLQEVTWPDPLLLRKSRLLNSPLQHAYRALVMTYLRPAIGTNKWQSWATYMRNVLQTACHEAITLPTFETMAKWLAACRAQVGPEVRTAHPSWTRATSPCEHIS